MRRTNARTASLSHHDSSYLSDDQLDNNILCIIHLSLSFRRQKQTQKMFFFTYKLSISPSISKYPRIYSTQDILSYPPLMYYAEDKVLFI